MRWKLGEVQDATEMERAGRHHVADGQLGDVDENTHLLQGSARHRAHSHSSLTGNDENGAKKRTVAVEDLYPTPPSLRTWTARDFAAIWVSLSITVTTYMFGSSLLAVGLNWWHATLAVCLGNVIVLIPLLLNGYAGTKYGIAFPIFLRSSFGRRGAVVAALSRGIVAIGWFAFNVWLGAQAIYSIILCILPFLDEADPWLGDLIGVSLLQFMAFAGFLFVHMIFVYKGIESMKIFEVVTSPLLGVSALVLLAWAWISTGSLTAMLDATNQFENDHGDDNEESNIAWLFRAFLPGLTAMVGAWSTMALNILDFTRFAKSQQAQLLGQSVGLPIPTTLFAFVGIAVTGASALLYGKPLWQPAELFDHFPVVWRVVANSVLVFSVLAMNITANLVSPANDFSNINPDRINFKMGGYITGAAGLLIMPWKLFSDANDFIFIWLIGYSAVLGAIAGVMLCDFNILKRRSLIVEELYFDPAKGGDEDLTLIVTSQASTIDQPDGGKCNQRYSFDTDSEASKQRSIGKRWAEDEMGDPRVGVLAGVGIYEYWRGWNVWAGIAVLLGLLPCVPGFLVAARILPEPATDFSSFLRLIVSLYNYAWFVAIVISFLSYYIFMRYSRWNGQARYEHLLNVYRRQNGDQAEDEFLSYSRILSNELRIHAQPPDIEHWKLASAAASTQGLGEERKCSPSPQQNLSDERPSTTSRKGSASDSWRRYTSGPEDLLEDHLARLTSSGRRVDDSPTIEKYQEQQRRERRRRSRQLVAEWRQRQKERAERRSRGELCEDEDDRKRYMFIEDEELGGEELLPPKNEDEEKHVRSHFVEYTEEEFEEMQRSLVREGVMSPPDHRDESHQQGRWTTAEKHLSI